MDAFYASVEQMDKPELRDKPVAVGGSRERGVVAAASYEARKFGVRSAQASALSARLCPDLIFVKPRFERYKEISSAIRSVFYDYTDLVEPLSLDEAFLDVTHNHKGLPSATLIAMDIRKRIKKEIGLTASAGVSVNKFLAKVASDINKPDGLTLISPDEVDSFTAKLPIDKFFGVGKVTAEKMKQMGIFSGADLRNWTRPELVRRFGKPGGYYYNIARGIDERPVKPHRQRKSVGAESTFSKDVADLSEQLLKLRKLAQTVAQRMEKGNHRGRTVQLKLRYRDFSTFSRSRTLDHYTRDVEEIYTLASALLKEHPREQSLRLLGISVSSLEKAERSPEGAQLTIDF